MGAVKIENGTVTYGGQTNTHHIVEFRYVLPGSTQTVSSGPVDIAPGAFVVVGLPSGTYTFGVTYDDGHSERLQAPPDPVIVYADEETRILFVY